MPLNNFTYSVSWSDFTQRTSSPAGVAEDAQIHPQRSFSNFKLAKKGNAVIITDVDIDIALVSTDGWVVSTQMSNDLLKHEQGHYDILALSARELFNDLLTLTAASSHKLQQKVDALKTKAGQLVKKVDARYDTQTIHSRNTQVQQTWDQKIAAEKQKPNGSINNLP